MDEVNGSGVIRVSAPPARRPPIIGVSLTNSEDAAGTDLPPPAPEMREAGVRARLLDITGPHPAPAQQHLLARLLISFTRKTPEALDTLARLLDQGNPAAIREHVHKLKGSAATLGATTLAAQCARIEHAAWDGTPPECRDVMPALQAEFGALVDTLTVVAADLIRQADQQGPGRSAAACRYRRRW